MSHAASTPDRRARSPQHGRATTPDRWSTSTGWPTHLDDPDLRIVHVSPDRRVYNKRHIPGATYSDLHKELALKGTAPETGDAEREWLIPTREQTERLLRRWRVGEGDRIVFYDDIGHEPPGDPRLLAAAAVPVPDRSACTSSTAASRPGGAPASATTTELPEADLADGAPQAGRARRARRLAHRDLRRGARLEPRGDASRRRRPTRILDVRTAAEWVGTDLRAKRGGHIPGARQRCFVDLLTDEGTFRPVDEMVSLVRASGADPAEIRATYCQGGVRAALVWFVLHELAGFDERPELRRLVGGVGATGPTARSRRPSPTAGWRTATSTPYPSDPWRLRGSLPARSTGRSSRVVWSRRSSGRR